MREKTMPMYGGAISGEQKEISKLLNAYAGPRRWHRVYERSENIKESGPAGPEVERKKRERLGKARTYYRMHICRHVHFRASDPRGRRLFTSRHLLAKPAGLFTYLLPCHSCVPFLLPLAAVYVSFVVFSLSSFPRFSSLPPLLLFLVSRSKEVFTFHRSLY